VEPVDDAQGTAVRGARRDAILAWTVCGLGCACCAWLGATSRWQASLLADVFEGLRIATPLPTAFLLANGWWLDPAVFGGLAALLILKEIQLRDKRTSAIVSCLLTITALLVAQGMAALQWLPLDKSTPVID
jgi:hypothetical protein